MPSGVSSITPEPYSEELTRCIAGHLSVDPENRHLRKRQHGTHLPHTAHPPTGQGPHSGAHLHGI